MPLAEYLASEQAREDVYAVIGVRGVIRRTWGTLAELRTDGIAWMQIQCKVGKSCRTVYYRPDGDRFVVTDLGEGVRTACLRGLDLANAEHFERLNALGRTLDADFRQTAPLGWIELRDITAADLPDAICRVMLASLRVMEAVL